MRAASTKAALLAAVVGMVVALTSGATTVTAQSRPPASPTPIATPLSLPPQIPMGVVSGTVRNGTAGPGAPRVSIQLIGVTQGGQIQAQTVESTDGTFRFSAPADPTISYLIRTEYQGVQYLDPQPILIAPEASTAQREVTVWETTSARPTLRVERTTVYLEGVDGQEGRLQFRREDVVVNGTDRVYVGGEDRRTLRIPVPEGVLAVDEQQAFDATATLEQGVVVTTQPLRPGKTTVRTRVLAEYDPRGNEYALRVTAPLPTDAMEVHAPRSLVGGVRPTANAVIGRPVDADGERWLVTRRDGATAEGESMVVTLNGLSGIQAANPLTSMEGAGAAVAVALGVLVLGAVAVVRVRGTQAGDARARGARA